MAVAEAKEPAVVYIVTSRSLGRVPEIVTALEGSLVPPIEPEGAPPGPDSVVAPSDRLRAVTPTPVQPRSTPSPLQAATSK